ncbi:MAG: hypothetical protein J1D88_04675 [Treponema sp.]|nr:hypothetical protein [Treponema sp.]
MLEPSQNEFFSKKTSMIVLIISIVILVCGTVLVLFSGKFIDTAYDFFAHHVFHREFKLEKWLPTIEALFSFPIFAVVFVNAVLFPKYSLRTKMVLLSSVLVAVGFSIVYSTAVATNANINSDLAAEFILAKECVLEHSFLPTGYYYGTEIRTLNTELISAPIFLFTNNWLLNKTLTTFFCCVIIFFVTWHFLKVLRIESVWLKYLISFLIFFPISYDVLYIATWGNYYIPHVVISILFLCCFIKLVTGAYTHKKFAFWFFLVFSFVCGLSTIRYVLNFVIPLSFAAVFLELKASGIDSAAKLKGFWLENFTAKVSVLSVIFTGGGYIFGSTVLHLFYKFSHWNKIQFCRLGETSVLDLVRAVLSHYGFQENVSVMTPSGFINLMVIAGLLLLVYMVSVVLRDKEIPYTHRLVLVFAAISFGLNTFVYYFVEFYSRYYYSVLVFIFPVIAIIMQSKKNSKVLKYLLCVCFGTAFTASAFITVEHFINLNSNKKREGYIEFLNNSDYTHGYAIFADANVTVFLTNGRVTVENLDNDAAEDGTFVLKKEYSYKKWLTPARYYTDIYEGNVFLLLSKQTYENCRDYELIRNGIVVYEDSAYIIFDYESAQKFKESF